MICGPAGRIGKGEEVLACRLTNVLGTEATVLTLGGTLRSCLVADERGERADVVLGFDTPEEYLAGEQYFGATVGRYANRIAHGRFSIAGKPYQLEQNAPPNTEHGGPDGFHRRLWTLEGTADAHGAAVRLSLVSLDGDQGFPGELKVALTYTLSDENDLKIDFEAVAGATTVVNLTHHGYWALAGAGSGSALDGRLSIDAEAYTPVNASMIPTGALASVEGTAFDFRTPRTIGARIRDGSEPQLILGRGYDHNFVLREGEGALRPAARLEDPRSGRVLEVLTTEPGLQLYTANWLTGAIPGKGGCLYRQGDGIALETQHFPDSPNQPDFPSTLLEAGRPWTSSTVYRFSALSHRDIARSDLSTRKATAWGDDGPARQDKDP